MKSLLLAALLAAPTDAARPLTPPAPDFPPGAGWINSKPLTMTLLRGRKVTVVAFLNLTSINTLRALPTLKSWFDRYAMSQLMLIGVLTPELEFHRDAVWARGRLKRLGIEFPVMLDSDRRLWKAYANEGWPALYLIDGDGRLIYDRLGEGGEKEFEDEMRSALSELIGKEALPAAAVASPKTPAQRCGSASADVPLGARAKSRMIALDKDFTRRGSVIIESRAGEVSTRGRWNVEPDGLRLATDNDNKDQGTYLRVVYVGSQAMAVFAPPASLKPKTRFFIKQDDLWLHEGNAGKDIRFDEDGRSFVLVDSARLYDLIRDPNDHPHELYVIPERKDAGVYGFSFADSCLAADLP